MDNNTNPECPDYGSHSQNAREVLFPGSTDDTVFGPDDSAAIDRAAEAEYMACEGHR